MSETMDAQLKALRAARTAFLRRLLINGYSIKAIVRMMVNEKISVRELIEGVQCHSAPADTPDAAPSSHMATAPNTPKHQQTTGHQPASEDTTETG